jgi:hypothetical protein
MVYNIFIHCLVNQPNSPHPSWFVFKWGGTDSTCFIEEHILKCLHRGKTIVIYNCSYMHYLLCSISITYLSFIIWKLNGLKAGNVNIFESTKYKMVKYSLCYCFIVFNDTFNNISATSWRSVLLVEVIGGPGENHRPAAMLNHISLMTFNTHDYHGIVNVSALWLLLIFGC